MEELKTSTDAKNHVKEDRIWQSAKQPVCWNYFIVLYYMLCTWRLSLSYALYVDKQVVGVGEEAETVLNDSFHINEWRGMDFMEPVCIDLWLTSTF